MALESLPSAGGTGFITPQGNVLVASGCSGPDGLARSRPPRPFRPV